MSQLAEETGANIFFSPRAEPGESGGWEGRCLKDEPASLGECACACTQQVAKACDVKRWRPPTPAACETALEGARYTRERAIRSASRADDGRSDVRRKTKKKKNGVSPQRGALQGCGSASHGAAPNASLSAETGLSTRRIHSGARNNDAASVALPACGVFRACALRGTAESMRKLCLLRERLHEVVLDRRLVPLPRAFLNLQVLSHGLVVRPKRFLLARDLGGAVAAAKLPRQ